MENLASSTTNTRNIVDMEQQDQARGASNPSVAEPEKIVPNPEIRIAKLNGDAYNFNS